MKRRAQQEIYEGAPAEVPGDRKAASDEDAIPWSEFVALVVTQARRPLDARRSS